MQAMSRKKPTSAVQPSGEPPGDAGPPKKRYPSRDKVKYVGLPLNMYAALEKYAEEHSTEFDKKSVTWAARVLFGPFLQSRGLLEEPAEEESAEE